ncbi:LysR family transcriptional regulator [Cupriavidus metallidurans]|uniref:LysR family transcriptional regulator n=2 Tax=Cupriavidus metallidurans TaxID=119219 RepID=A0A482IVU4_9BURK|nr:LysR family transcriptional regulator [Cupriavidus metallidurans]
MRSLSRLKSLQALEAAARHGSFVGAAEELGVSAPAVGQLVRSLESWVGHSLLKRSRSRTARLTPVEEARAALDDIARGLDLLESGLHQLHGRSLRAIVVVSASQMWVSNWILPKLTEFSQGNPGIDIRFDVADRLNDILNGEADIGIRCGDGNWPGLVSTRLMGEEVTAVCSPALMPIGGEVSASWLSRQALIHDASSLADPQQGFPTWEAWYSKAGFGIPKDNLNLHFNASVPAVQAATSGKGVLLVRSRLVSAEIDSGRLVEIFPDHSWPMTWSYYAVASARTLRRKEVQLFHDWLLAQQYSEAKAVGQSAPAGLDDVTDLAL